MPDQFRIPNQFHMAWLAGVIDSSGRGCIAKNRHGGKRLILSISTPNEKCYQRILRMTGCGSHLSNYKFIWQAERRPCAEHCPEKHIHQESESTANRWSTEGISALMILYTTKQYSVGWKDSLRDLYSEAVSSPFFSRTATITNLIRRGFVLPPEVIFSKRGSAA